MALTMLTLYTLATITTIFSTFGLADDITPGDPTRHGLTIFYKISPTEEVISSFSTGNFKENVQPSSSYECPPNPQYPFHAPTFGCYNGALLADGARETTPRQIFDFGLPAPTCLTHGIAFEHLQWATWTHACWAHPSPALDTPEGHAEAAFQSNAMAFRRLVLYQHDMHVRTLNERIADLRVPCDAELVSMRGALDAGLAEMDAYYDGVLAKVPTTAEKDEGKKPEEGEYREAYEALVRERDAKKQVIIKDAEAATQARQRRFWVDSFQSRMKTVELDHLVGEYWERWMTSQTLEKWDWAGMGEPVPAWPREFERGN